MNQVNESQEPEVAVESPRPALEREWAISHEGASVRMVMSGMPTVELFDKVIDLIISSRNQWASEL